MERICLGADQHSTAQKVFFSKQWWGWVYP